MAEVIKVHFSFYSFYDTISHYLLNNLTEIVSGIRLTTVQSNTSNIAVHQTARTLFWYAGLQCLFVFLQKGIA